MALRSKLIKQARLSNAVLVESGTINRCALAPDTLRLRNEVTTTYSQVPDRIQLSAARGFLQVEDVAQALSIIRNGAESSRSIAILL